MDTKQHKRRRETAYVELSAFRYFDPRTCRSDTRRIENRREQPTREQPSASKQLAGKARDISDKCVSARRPHEMDEGRALAGLQGQEAAALARGERGVDDEDELAGLPWYITGSRN